MPLWKNINIGNINIFIILVSLYFQVSCSAGLITIPLSGGAEEGEYTLQVSAGTPPQPFTVKLTTADSALLLPSSSCKKPNCQRQYNASISTTSAPCNRTECLYKEIYSEGIPVYGNITKDMVQLTTLSNSSAAFVAFNNPPPSLYGSSSDGILGLSQWVPRYPGIHLLSQIENVTNSSDFSLCLGEFGGALVLGGYDTKYNRTEIVWAKLREHSNFTLELTDMKIETNTIIDFFNTTGKNCTNCVYAIIDAGNQFLRLPGSAYDAVKAIFQQRICSDSHNVGTLAIGICGPESFFTGNCYVIDDTTIDKFPTMTITVSGVTLTIPPTNYLVDFGGKACMALERGTGDNVIIGSRIIQEYYTVFEPNNNRVGFAKSSNCSGAQHKVIMVSGNGQRTSVGNRIARPLVVQVVRLNDSSPVQGINVSFNVVESDVAEDVMWISEAMWSYKHAKLEPTVVLTSENGTATTYLWVSGNPGTNIVTADAPLSLRHVVFTTQGDQSNIWRIMIYVFLFALIVCVILLNVWHERIKKRRQFYRSGSSINLSSQSLIRSNSDDSTSTSTSPPLSPVFSPTSPDFSARDKYDDYEDGEFGERYNIRRPWTYNIRRSMKRFSKRVGRLLEVK